MTSIPSGESRQYTFEQGKEHSIGGNRPMKFKIFLTSGGYLQGVIPANEKLVICSHGNDFENIEVIIDEDSTKHLSAV